MSAAATAADGDEKELRAYSSSGRAEEGWLDAYSSGSRRRKLQPNTYYAGLLMPNAMQVQAAGVVYNYGWQQVCRRTVKPGR